MEMEQELERRISRQERVQAARAAFGRCQSGDRAMEGRNAKNGVYLNSGGVEEGFSSHRLKQDQFDETPGGSVHAFRMIRVMAAWMLLLILILAFYNDFSYRGFDRDFVQQKLEDETTWNALEEKVQSAYQEVIVRLNQ